MVLILVTVLLLKTGCTVVIGPRLNSSTALNGAVIFDMNSQCGFKLKLNEQNNTALIALQPHQTMANKLTDEPNK